VAAPVAAHEETLKLSAAVRRGGHGVPPLQEFRQFSWISSLDLRGEFRCNALQPLDAFVEPGKARIVSLAAMVSIKNLL